MSKVFVVVQAVRVVGVARTFTKARDAAQEDATGRHWGTIPEWTSKAFLDSTQDEHAPLWVGVSQKNTPGGLRVPWARYEITEHEVRS